MNRREFVGAGVASALVASGKFFASDHFSQTDAGAYQSIYQGLDAFVEKYMRSMNAPGLTLVLADRDAVQRVVTYGFSDVEGQKRVTADDLFQIGSISKSFLANCLLQLYQEKKLDLHKPIVSYLPWFRIDSSFAPITTHHLLTHSSGLPGEAPVFLTDPAAKHRAAYEPGKSFHYNNMGYALMGHLLETLDGVTLPEALHKRVFAPLSMTQSEPVITFDCRARAAKNYEPFLTDRPYPRNGRLCEAPWIVMTDASGCIAATPRDMGRYVQMIARHGEGPSSRLLTDEGFALFSQPHIKAEEFGPTASYGYGIAVDTLEGHKILRHTGGMVSFASSMHVDIDEGVGAFASINAMQGYRPNPVAQYAIQLMRAQRSKSSVPVSPALTSPNHVENPEQYSGAFQSADGRKLDFGASGDDLSLQHDGQRVSLEPQGGDSFAALHPDFSRFAFTFGRADEKDPKSAVVEVFWGNDWFVNSKYKGSRTFDYPKEWNSYAGHYRNESPWLGSIRILVRKGSLIAEGLGPLKQQADGTFRSQIDEGDTEWIGFYDVVNGRAMRVKFSGEDLWRVMAP